ncbi:MAG: vWA domain-containing protein, partial [Planctomycetota bacterium]
FENQVRPWQRKAAIVPATPANKKKAVAFVENIKPQLGTATDHALEEAFRCLQADTFYLLTDGAPWRDGGRLPTRPILEDVKARNRYRGVRIMSLGFREANERFLKNLSRSSGGTYRAID